MKIPKVIKAVQHYKEVPRVEDPRGEISSKLAQFGLAEKIRPGMRIAITAGSRGVDGMVEVIAQIVQEVKNCGGDPFIFPSMGSHAGATSEGQLNMLRSLGYTDDVIKCPILSEITPVCIGETELGTPCYIDKNAWEADGVIVVNRIKKHTDHNNKTESGLLKMMTIGMGKRVMASYVHAQGVWGLTNIIPANGKFVCRNPEVNVICGVALLENQEDKLGYLEVVNGWDIPDREPELFKLADRLFPHLPFRTCDFLIIRRGGKEISGTGVDCNMIGRYGVWGLYEPEKLFAAGENEDFRGDPLIDKIALLDLTEISHGNAIGVGQVDLITKKYYDKIDFNATYTNGLTTTFLQKIKIPYVAPTDKDAIQTGMNCLNGLIRLEGKKNDDTVKVCVIDSTLHEGKFLVSKGLYDELKKRDDFEFIGDFEELEFDKDGNLLSNPLKD
ncbi:MAG: lactate racemase domain-containing protein [Clostridiales bacterium]|nr:lactate racemase domain-containing protein [Clostridiales bacterium]